MTLFSSLFGARLDRELGTDDSTVLFTSARRKAAINEAQEEFADLTECLQRRAVIALAGGTAEYDLTSTTVIPGGDFLRMTDEQVEVAYTDATGAVTWLAGDDLPRRDVAWLNRYVPGWQTSTVASSVAQYPQMYYERTDGGARYLGFWPTPSTGSSASMTATVGYLAAPTPMTSDTEQPFTVNSSVRTDLRLYHQALVHYAAYQLEKLRRDDQASDKQLQKFMAYVERFKVNARRKGGQIVTFAKNYWKSTRKYDPTGEDPRR